jgi:hypothetical protein
MTEQLITFASAATTSALAGLAALLRSNEAMTCRRVSSATLYSGILGLGISLLWYTKFQDNVYFLVGVSIVVGLSGQSTKDVVVGALRRAALPLLTGKESETKK